MDLREIIEKKIRVEIKRQTDLGFADVKGTLRGSIEARDFWNKVHDFKNGVGNHTLEKLNAERQRLRDLNINV